jgi:hypothetical protein
VGELAVGVCGGGLAAGVRVRGGPDLEHGAALVTPQPFLQRPDAAHAQKTRHLGRDRPPARGRGGDDQLHSGVPCCCLMPTQVRDPSSTRARAWWGRDSLLNTPVSRLFPPPLRSSAATDTQVPSCAMTRGDRPSSPRAGVAPTAGCGPRGGRPHSHGPDAWPAPPRCGRSAGTPAGGVPAPYAPSARGPPTAPGADRKSYQYLDLVAPHPYVVRSKTRCDRDYPTRFDVSDKSHDD